MKSINIDIYSCKKSNSKKINKFSTSQLALNSSKQEKVETVNFNQFIYGFS